jgi:hypothetical protein
VRILNVAPLLAPMRRGMRADESPASSGRAGSAGVRVRLRTSVAAQERVGPGADDLPVVGPGAVVPGSGREVEQRRIGRVRRALGLRDLGVDPQARVDRLRRGGDAQLEPGVARHATGPQRRSGAGGEAGPVGRAGEGERVAGGGGRERGGEGGERTGGDQRGRGVRGASGPGA